MKFLKDRLTLILLFYFLAIAFAVVHAYPGMFKDLFSDSKIKRSRSSRHIVTFLNKPVVPLQNDSFTSVYRGDIHRTGASSETLSTRLKPAWTYRTLNVGIHTASKATPAIDESGVYVGSDEAWFYAFDHDGKLKWKFFVGGADLGIHGTASLDQQYVYFGAYNGSLYCLDKNTGSLVWVVRLGDALGASPVLYQDSVYVGVELNDRPNGFMARVLRSNGELVWRSPLMGDQDHCSPTIDETHHLVFGGANTGNVYAYDLTSGEQKWSQSVGGAVKSTSPLIDNVLYVSSWGKNFSALNPETGQIIWQTPLKWGSRSSATLVPKLNYFIVSDESGNIYAIESKHGTVVWTIDTKIHRYITSALVIKDERGKYLAWLPCRDHTFCALNPENGKIVATYPLETALTSVPVVWKNDLYLALDKTGGLVKMTRVSSK